ncbi:MAG: hypothetical protein ACRDJ9_32745 [Dehalococcoidia bacterium]
MTQRSAAVRARLIKELAALQDSLEAGLRRWLAAPVEEGGMGFDAARVERAIAHWRPPPKEEKEKPDA